MKPTKLILSRKGFDSGEKSGHGPSPIFSNGTMFSLPIPSESPEGLTYGDLRHGRLGIGQVVADLTDGDYRPGDIAHLDPDINRKAYRQRHTDWRPLYGQRDRAQGHLRNQGVGVGDVFLFFGLYQRTKPVNHQLRFDESEPRLHVLWGWLQIGGIHRVDDLGEQDFPWARYHDHFSWSHDPSNTLYLASNKLDLGNGPIGPGAGVFPRFHESLVLTNPEGSGLTEWRLPPWFYPSNGKKPLSYHDPKRTKFDRWTPKPSRKYAYLQSVARGQEFVLDLADYPEALGWVSGLVGDLGRP